MHTQERQAWYTLGCIMIPTALYGGLVPFVGVGHGLEGIFGLCGLAGLAEFIGRKARQSGRVVCDERDHAIARRAGVAAYAVFWLVFVAAGMVPWFLMKALAYPSPTATIPVEALPLFVAFATLLVFTVRSIVMIVLYRTGGSGDGDATAA